MVYLKSLLIITSILNIFTQNATTTTSSKTNCFLLGGPNINVKFILIFSPFLLLLNAINIIQNLAVLRFMMIIYTTILVTFLLPHVLEDIQALKITFAMDVILQSTFIQITPIKF